MGVKTELTEATATLNTLGVKTNETPSPNRLSQIAAGIEIAKKKIAAALLAHTTGKDKLKTALAKAEAEATKAAAKSTEAKVALEALKAAKQVNDNN